MVTGDDVIQYALRVDSEIYASEMLDVHDDLIRTYSARVIEKNDSSVTYLIESSDELDPEEIADEFPDITVLSLDRVVAGSVEDEIAEFDFDPSDGDEDEFDYN